MPAGARNVLILRVALPKLSPRETLVLDKQTGKRHTSPNHSVYSALDVDRISLQRILVYMVLFRAILGVILKDR